MPASSLAVFPPDMVEARCDLKSEDPYGQVSNGRLVLGTVVLDAGTYSRTEPCVLSLDSVDIDYEEKFVRNRGHHRTFNQTTHSQLLSFRTTNLPHPSLPKRLRSRATRHAFSSSKSIPSLKEQDSRTHMRGLILKGNATRASYKGPFGPYVFERLGYIEPWGFGEGSRHNHTLMF